MATSTELYINAELPKRIYTDQFPLTVGHVPVATGNGLEIVARQLDVADVANAASQQDITDAIDALIDNAPAALDTLNELAAALGDDANYASTVATALGNRLRVDVNTQGLTATEQQNGMDNLGVSEVITGASIDGSGVITFTKNGVAADDTVQVPTAVDGLSFNATTGEMTLSYTNGVADSTITVASNEVADNVFRVKDNGDGTKKIAFEASGITTATTRTVTMPDRNVDLGKHIEHIVVPYGPGSYTVPAGAHQRISIVDTSMIVNLDALTYGDVCEIVAPSGLTLTRGGATPWKDANEVVITGSPPLTLATGEMITALSYGSFILITRSEVLASSFKIIQQNRSAGGVVFNVSNTTALRSITMPNRNIDLDGVGAIPDYFNGTSYTIGQNVYYGGQEFRCRTAHTSSTAIPDYTKFSPVSGTLHITNSSAVTITPPANNEIKNLIITSTSSFTLNSAAVAPYPVTIISNNALPDYLNYITVSATPYPMAENGVTVKNIMLRGGESATVTQGNYWTKGRVNTTDWAAYERYDAGDLIIKDGTLLKVSSAHSGDTVFYPTTYNATTPLTIPGCKVSKDYLSQQYPWTANFLNASSTYSMVLFGNNNSIRNIGDGKAVLSGIANTIGYQTNNGLTTVSSSGSVICGGANNSVSIDTANEYASCLVGGYQNTVSGAGSFLGGGYGNKGSGNYAVLCGGQENTTRYNGDFTNGRGGAYLTIVNGFRNRIERLSGGKPNYGTILNGNTNYVGDTLDYGLVINGSSNSVTAGDYATVINGIGNSANGWASIIGNGQNNIASGQLSVVLASTNSTASGQQSVVLGGLSNTASGLNSTILNGSSNTASGQLSAVISGSSNTISGISSVVVSGSSNSILKNNVVAINAKNIDNDAITQGDIVFGGIGTSSFFRPGYVIHFLSGYSIGSTAEATITGATGDVDTRIIAANLNTSVSGGSHFGIGVHTVEFVIQSANGLAGLGVVSGVRRVTVLATNSTASISIVDIQTIGTDYVSPALTVHSIDFALSGNRLVVTASVDPLITYSMGVQMVVHSHYNSLG